MEKNADLALNLQFVSLYYFEQMKNIIAQSKNTCGLFLLEIFVKAFWGLGT